MRRFGRFALSLIVVLASFVATAVADEAWKPQRAPAGARGSIEAEIFVLAGSVSGTAGFEARMKSAAAAVVSGVKPGTYVIVATSRNPVRVVADRFIFALDDRAVLLDAIDHAPVDASTTDVDRLEEFVLRIREATTQAYRANGLRLRLSMLTDGVPQTNDRGFDVLAGRATTRLALGGGLQMYSLTFTDVLPPSVATRVESTAGATISPGAAHDSDNASSGGGPLTAVVVVIVLVLVVAIVVALTSIRRARARGRTTLQLAPETSPTGVAALVPTSLRFSEWSASADGARRSVQVWRTVAYVPGMPVIVGGDTFVAAFALLDASAPPRVCSVNLDGKGIAVITPLADGVLIDDVPALGPVNVDARAEHVVSLDSLEVRIGPAVEKSGSDDVFFRRNAVATPNGSAPKGGGSTNELNARPVGRS